MKCILLHLVNHDVLTGLVGKRIRKQYTSEEKKGAVDIQSSGVSYNEIQSRTGIPASSARRYSQCASVDKIRFARLFTLDVLYA